MKSRNILKTGPAWRDVYVELEPSADADEVAIAIVNDPRFLDEPALVFPVPSNVAWEQTNHGVTLERHAVAGEASHASFLLETRYDKAGLAARMMLAATRALQFLQAGTYSLLDLPSAALWGEQRPVAEKKWL